MILPIIAAISREVFLQTPRENIEAAYALGATRWEMIRLAVLPYGRSRRRSARSCWASAARWARPSRSRWCSRTTSNFVDQFLEPGGNTIAANIALQFGDAVQTRPGRADRLRPGAVRDHLAGQPAGPADHRARGAIPEDERWTPAPGGRRRSTATWRPADDADAAPPTCRTAAGPSRPRTPPGRRSGRRAGRSGRAAPRTSPSAAACWSALAGAPDRSTGSPAVTVATFLLALLPLISILVAGDQQRRARTSSPTS